MPARPGQVKWTHELRKIVFARLTMEFGPHSNWGGKDARYPQGNKDRFEAVKEELARYLSTLTGKSFVATSLEKQIDWACTAQNRVQDSGHARQFILNKAAALEAGFLQQSDLPSYISGIKHADEPGEEADA
jgi:hypothetical protein